MVSHELTVYLSVFGLFLNQWIMVILSKGCKPDNFASHNSLKLSFTNIGDHHSNLLTVNLFLNLCETNLGDSVDSGNFSVRGYLSLIRKDSGTQIVLQFMWRKDFLLHRTHPRKTLSILAYVFGWLYFTQCLPSFSSINLLRLYAWFLMLFYLT